MKESEVKPEFKAKGIHEAGRALALLNLSDDERYAYDRYIGDVRISKSTTQSYFIDGLLEGRAEGKAEMIRGMHQLGLPIEQICIAAQLSQKQVQEVLQQ